MSMLRLQIGPVQDFIAAARTKCDLWSGSYLLSWLMAAGIHALQAAGAEVIFPCAEELEICRFYAEHYHAGRSQASQEAATPCLTNKLTARVPAADADRLARLAEEAVRREWRTVADAAWKALPPLLQDADRRARFDSQTAHHLSVDYTAIPWDTDLAAVAEQTAHLDARTPLRTALAAWQADPSKRYAALYHLLDYRMDSVRRLRRFEAWNGGEGRDAAWKIGTELAKDSLTGREERIFCYNDLCRGNRKEQLEGWEHAELFRTHPGDHIGAITLIKRLWHLGMLQPLAGYIPQEGHERGPAPAKGKDSYYYAVLAMDGDQIGKALTKAPTYDVDDDYHRKFSTALARFAQKKARDIVEEHGGDLIYAGGDDVLALLPLQRAIACAKKLRDEFRHIMREEAQVGMDVSAGLSLVHSKADLQSAIAAARQAESRAKNTLERGAFSVCLMKRSGEIHQWGAKWESGAIELLENWQKDLDAGILSARASHRYAQLLTPYLHKPTGLCEYRKNPDYEARQTAIALAELRSMLDRQCGDKNAAAAIADNFAAYIGNKQTQGDLMDDLVGLCAVIGFLNRKDNKD